jgi:cell division protein FtsL
LIQINTATRLPPKVARMARRRISNIEVAAIATVVLSVVVLAVVLLSPW